MNISKAGAPLPPDNDSTPTSGSDIPISRNRSDAPSPSIVHRLTPRRGTSSAGPLSSIELSQMMNAMVYVSASDSASETSAEDPQIVSAAASSEQITRCSSPAASASSHRPQSPNALDNPALRHLRPAGKKVLKGESAGSMQDVLQFSFVPPAGDNAAATVMTVPRTVSLAFGRSSVTEDFINRWAHDVARSTGGPIPVGALAELVQSMQGQPVAATIPGKSELPPSNTRQRRRRSTSENAYPFSTSPPRSEKSAASNQTSSSGTSIQTRPFDRLQRDRRRRTLSSPNVINVSTIADSGKSTTIPALALKPGTVMERAGRGGAATVFSVVLAQDLAIRNENLGSKFAFKALYRKTRIDELKKEIEASMKVRELPNMMQVYGIVEINGTTGILAEYIHGKSSQILFSTARRAVETGSISAEEFFGLVRHSFSDLLLGLATMNDLGISHNDISSTNLMFSFDTNKLKIIDFGRASEFGAKPEINTVHYMAPEIAETLGTRPTDRKMDAFSAGQVLHEWIFGHPLDWANIKELMSQANGAGPSVFRMKKRYGEYVRKTYDPREGYRQGAIALPFSKIQESKVVEVIGRLLQGDPLNRASAEEVMQLDFFEKIPSIKKIANILAKIRIMPPNPVDGERQIHSAP